jgi:hypothetical protein
VDSPTDSGMSKSAFATEPGISWCYCIKLCIGWILILTFSTWKRIWSWAPCIKITSGHQKSVFGEARASKFFWLLQDMGDQHETSLLDASVHNTAILILEYEWNLAAKRV